MDLKPATRSISADPTSGSRQGLGLVAPAGRSGRVVLISGASSGIGAACARRLAHEGYRVYGAARSLRPSEPGAPIQTLTLDVTDDAAVKCAVDTVLAREGCIDVLVNNAGYALYGAVDEITLEEARAQLEVNFFGYLRLIKAVLPSMRARGTGTIVNVSSLGGLLGLPFQSLYSASKFAVEGFSEGLALELAGDGIQVVLLEPSDMKTGFTARRQRAAGSRAGSSTARSERVLAVVQRDEQRGPAPEQAAELLSRVLRAATPKLRYPVGSFSQRCSVALRSWLPERWFLASVGRYYGLGRAP